MQVYLPDDLYREVKERRLHASELLQEAVRREVLKQELISEGSDYLADLVAEVGEPTSREQADAAAVARQIRAHQVGRAS